MQGYTSLSLSLFARWTRLRTWGCALFPHSPSDHLENVLHGTILVCSAVWCALRNISRGSVRHESGRCGGGGEIIAYGLQVRKRLKSAQLQARWHVGRVRCNRSGRSPLPSTAIQHSSTISTLEPRLHFRSPSICTFSSLHQETKV